MERWTELGLHELLLCRPGFPNLDDDEFVARLSGDVAQHGGREFVRIERAVDAELPVDTAVDLDCVGLRDLEYENVGHVSPSIDCTSIVRWLRRSYG